MFDEQTRHELEQLSALANKYKYGNRDVQEFMHAHGFIIEPANFYSTVPQITEIESAFEYREDMPFSVDGIFDHEVLRENLLDLAEFSVDFDPPIEGEIENPTAYFWKNGLFSYSDAMSYYAMIRKTKPGTIIEVGSGFSTLIAAEAVAHNGGGRIICIEPFPRPWLKALAGVELIERPVQEIGADFFNEHLRDGDILFIDSTHTVKIGSDCLHLYLRVIPAIERDVLLHVHDVFLPYGMPQHWAVENHIYWTEQYLLLAYLLGNPRCAMVFGSHYAHKKLSAELDVFMHGRYPGGGGSFWMRHVPLGSRASNRL